MKSSENRQNRKKLGRDVRALLAHVFKIFFSVYLGTCDKQLNKASLVRHIHKRRQRGSYLVVFTAE